MAGASAHLQQPAVRIERLAPLPLAAIARMTPPMRSTARLAAFTAGPGVKIREALALRSDGAELSSWLAVVRAIGAAPDEEAAEAVSRLLLHVIESGALDRCIKDEGARAGLDTIVRNIAGMGLRAKAWVRALGDWRPDDGPVHGQVQLARHLFVKWDMPFFMEGVWFSDWKVWGEWQDWYVHMGAGGSPLERAPFPVSRREARFLAEAPGWYSLPKEVFRLRAYLQLRVLGADHAFAHVLSQSQLGDSRLVSEQEDRRAFWMSVARYFIRHPEFPARQLEPVIDYLTDMKFGWSAGVTPLQPGLTMKGRTPDALLRGMLLWRTDRRRGELGRVVFKPSGHKGLVMKDEAGKPVWTITELLSAAELSKESASMHHCVHTYGMACVAGRCSIWSLARVSSDGRTVRKLTIEVAPDRRIVQARGRYNRWPLPEERKVLALWAEAEGLSLSNPAMGLLPESLQPMAQARG